MQYLITPYSDSNNTLAWWDGGFTNQELDYLQNLAVSSSREYGMLGGSNNGEKISLYKPEYRSTKIGWLSYSQESHWVFQKLSNIVSSLNSRFFRFDLTGFGENIQLCNYEAEENGQYNWHLDYGNGVSRKLSLVLQLSNPEDYEGGELQIKTNSDVETIVKKRGFISVFPSFILHRVSPVTKGSRQSLVVWISGAPFR